MSVTKLIIANKKSSSWSLRPWLAMKVRGIDFEETLSPFDYSTNHAHFWEFSPTKKVPVLVHNGFTVWDSLAILEYLAELHPDKMLWPSDQKQRAHARAVSNEMHSGFAALRDECPMNMSRQPGAVRLSEDTKTDIRRIETLWADCLTKYGGPFLFGEFSIADAMYAPVVNRMQVYFLGDSQVARQYCKTISELPAWKEWEAAGKAETWVSEVVGSK